MAKPKEKELSALELMIEHADKLGSSVVGMPKKRKAANGADFSFDFNRNDTEESDDEYYVGPGSRAKNREAKQRRNDREKSRQIDVTVNAAPQPRAVSPVAPNPRDVESALEDLFVVGEKSGDEIVKAIQQGNAVSAKTQQALEDWLDWEKSEAFKAKSKAKSDPLGKQPGARADVFDPNAGANDDDGADGPGLDTGGDSGNGNGRRRRGTRRGRRYGRGRGQRRNGRRRNLPRRGFRGKLGAVLGIAALGGTLLAGNWLKERSQEEFVDENANNGGVGAPDGSDEPQPTPVEQQPASGAKTPEETNQPHKEAPSAAQDAAVSGASMLLMGASKRIPVIGPALGNGLTLANDMQHIDADETMTEQEKSQEKKRATYGAAGGTVGGSAGTMIGGFIGGALGSIIPVAGTAAGAMLGSTIGGILGDYFGTSIGEYVSDKITDESDKMLADGEKDRKEKMDEYNDTVQENQDKSKFPAPATTPFNLGSLFGGMMGTGGGTYQGPMRAQPAQRMDSKQVTDIAQRAIAEGGLGSVSEQFESGGRGVGTISTGQGDAGGVSYGKHQLATNNGSMMNFLNSPEGKPFLARFGGLAPGTSQFNSVYKDVASTQGSDLDKAQSDYITRTHYAPMVAKLQNDVGVDLSSRGSGVKEMLYSTSVQYGAGSSVIANALQGKDVNAMSDEDLIKAVQDYKAATTDRYFKSSSAQTQQSVAVRAQNEKDVLLKVHEAEQRKKAVNEPKPVETDAEQDARIAAKFPNLPKGDGTHTDTPEVDANLKNLPDFTGKGAVMDKSSQDDYDKQLKERVGLAAPDVARIEPVVQSETPVERQPLVTEGDIARAEAPEPVTVAAPAPAQPPSGAVSRHSTPSKSGQRPGNAHSLDSIPVFLDDPMLNAITMGYM